MSSASRVSVRWTVLVAASLMLLVVGASATYLGLRIRQAPQTPGDHAKTSGPPTASVPASHERAPVATMSAPLPDVVVPFSRAAVERAGVTVTPVTAGAASEGVRAPGVVEPNAYKVVSVTPLVGGRITRVAAELGQHVRRGETIAQIFSPELAEWQTRYISERAELEAHERELARTEKLAEIGAASRQELERIHAEHTARRAALQSAASRLRLLGLSDGAIETLDTGKTLEPTIGVPAPIAGVVTERTANVGLNVDRNDALFTVVDLSSVWVVADVYEKDFAHVQIGTSARVTTPAYPDLVVRGRVSYIDPQVSAATRTVRVRVEVPNLGGELRLGMFLETLLEGGRSESAMIPRSAVQHVGDRSVVYLVNPKSEGEFIQRDVKLGEPAGDQVQVLAGVRAGDVVVSEGSFAVRAERERLGLRSGPAPVSDAGAQQAREAVQTAKVAVGEQRFDPATVRLRAGVPARLTFIRTTDTTCATEIAVPSLNIKRPLPLNTPVVIEFTPSKAGEIAFACGMGMLKGVVVVQ